MNQIIDPWPGGIALRRNPRHYLPQEYAATTACGLQVAYHRSIALTREEAEATCQNCRRWLRHCRSTYQGAVTLLGRPVRCDLEAGHAGGHGNSFAARYWS